MLATYDTLCWNVVFRLFYSISCSARNSALAVCVNSRQELRRSSVKCENCSKSIEPVIGPFSVTAFSVQPRELSKSRQVREHPNASLIGSEISSTSAREATLCFGVLKKRPTESSTTTNACCHQVRVGNRCQATNARHLTLPMLTACSSNDLDSTGWRTFHLVTKSPEQVSQLTKSVEKDVQLRGSQNLGSGDDPEL